MTIPGSTNPLLAYKSSAAAYTVSRSLRFNSADSAYLNWTPAATASSSQKLTYSTWVKRSGLSAFQHFGLNGAISSTSRDSIRFDADNTISVFFDNGASFILNTVALFRDCSAWYHIVVSIDTTQATASNRVKVYVNNAEQTLTGTQPTQNYNFTGFLVSSKEQNIGRRPGTSTFYYLNGYLAEIHCIDGQAKTPSDFAETNATTGQWVPKSYTGTYGTNGFKLTFSDNSNTTAATLGKDTSGNGNNWTLNNFSITDTTTVATAGGAKPILNTTDAYGGTLGTGVASDSNASSLYLCAALATSAGVNLTDQQPTGRTTPSLTINNPGGFTSTTTTSQYYGGSLNLTGGNYLTVTSGLGIFTGNFTIEAWFRRTGTTALMTLFDTWCNQTSGTGFYMWWDGGGLDLVKDSGAYYVDRAGTDLPINTWCHVALVRSSNTFTCYVNGSSLFTYTVVDNWNSNRINIGGASTNGVPWVGQIQDVRIYNTAKYTSNFSVPSRTIGSGNDSLRDTPTSSGTDTGVGGEVMGNYCTWNPLKSTGTITNGGLDATYASTTGIVTGTFAVSSGKWYWEITPNDSYNMLGILSSSVNVGGSYPLENTGGWGYFGANGRKYPGAGGIAYGSPYNSGDVIGFALDMDAGTLVCYKNGVSQGTLTSGLTGAWSPAAEAGTAGTYSCSANFGQRAFAYTAPSGFKALCDTNLTAPTIAKPNTVMDTVLYTGTGASLTPTSSLGFSPDLVWIKSRSAATDHALYDTVRGATKDMASNTTAVETTETQGLTAFNSNGFTVGTLAKLNTNAATYAGWCWDAGSSNATNTNGTITSTVRTNVSAGFSIVTYTGTGANATVGHSLGVAPQLVVVKRRDNAAGSWLTWHTSIAATDYLAWNSTAAVTTLATVWNSTAPTSSVFSIGTSAGVNTSASNYVAYCWAPVAGLSSFGQYSGNSNVDGPFVYTGFRPRFVMQKTISGGASHWFIYDSARSTYNPSQFYLLASSASGGNIYDALTVDLPLDILSNGFKLRNADAGGYTNYTGYTYLYAAFAENPFQYARAR